MKNNITTNDTKSTEKKPTSFYTWGLVTYTSEEEIMKFCHEQGRNWAFAKHDKEGEEHTHVVITFEQRKSFKSVTRLCKTYFPDCNTFAEAIDDVGGAIAYLTHETDKAREQGKYQYNREIVKYSKKEFYTKYMKGEEISANELFLEDLLRPEREFSIIVMAKRYGRDFIKNATKYLDFRRAALAEKMGVSSIRYYGGTYTQDELTIINENSESENKTDET